MNRNDGPVYPVLPYLRAFLGSHSARLSAAWRRDDRGASAVELAIITAVLLGIAVALLAVIKTFVTNQQSQIANTKG